MSNVYEAFNDHPRIFVSYGGKLTEALYALADKLDDVGLSDVEPISLTYTQWDGEHSITAVISI